MTWKQLIQLIVAAARRTRRLGAGFCSCNGLIGFPFLIRPINLEMWPRPWALHQSFQDFSWRVRVQEKRKREQQGHSLMSEGKMDTDWCKRPKGLICSDRHTLRLARPQSVQTGLGQGEDEVELLLLHWEGPGEVVRTSCETSPGRLSRVRFWCWLRTCLKDQISQLAEDPHRGSAESGRGNDLSPC